MRERITFIQPLEERYEETEFKIRKDALEVRGLNAIREDRLTFGFAELPQEVWLCLKQCHELHIRWSSKESYTQRSPFDARTSPGLHVFFTPRINLSACEPLNLRALAVLMSDRTALCPLLKKVFSNDLRCPAPKTSFAAVPIFSERFASSASYHFYSALPSLRTLQEYLLHKVCTVDTTGQCVQKVKPLKHADYIDIDFDSVSQAVNLRILRSKPPSTKFWQERISQTGDSRVEVGLLAAEVSREPEKQSFRGLLAVLGEDSKPKPAQFSFPSRHHTLPPSNRVTFITSFAEPNGLHPTLQLTFSSRPVPPEQPACALHAFLTLPSFLFADKYQLADQLFLASKNLQKLHVLYGESDLEAPDWAVKRWGSAMLLELAPPGRGKDASEPWRAEIPMHLRYMAPARKGTVDLEVPVPVVFWACYAEEGTKMNVNPFDRVNLGYDGLFGPKTMFYHVEPAFNTTRRPMVSLRLPILDTSRSNGLDSGTGIIILLGLAWILWKIAALPGRPRTTTSSTIPDSKKQR